MRPRLVFVYNADSGLFNTVSDIAHKLLSPATYACKLCALTHGHFKIREQWVTLLKTLDADCEFLHRDEFVAQYGATGVALPAIFERNADKLLPLIDAAALDECTSLDALSALLTARLQHARPTTR